MTCATPSNICVTCKTLDKEHKPKCGIILCIGCKNQFCLSHMTQHRQYLNDLLDSEVVCERNALQEKISLSYEERWSATIRVQIEAINNWEENAIEQIKRSAVSAREQLNEIALKEYECLQKNFSILSNQLNTLRENENYFENDIDQLKNKFQRMKNELEQCPVELNISEIPKELISVKLIVQRTIPVVPSYYFVDKVLKSQNPKASIDISKVKTGEMFPIKYRMVAFYSDSQFPALNTNDGSWHSLIPIIQRVRELHWSDHLQRCFVLVSWNRTNTVDCCYQYDPMSGKQEEILMKCYSGGNYSTRITTLTCFKTHVLIVDGNKIDKWVANDNEWYKDSQSTERWLPPISCDTDSTIICIRMNDLYYAVLLKKTVHGKEKSESSYFFELRNHGMSILQRIRCDYTDLPQGMRMCSLPNALGWLWFYFDKQKRYCYVYDNDGKRHDQNIVLSSNVTDIVIEKNLIFIRKAESDVCDDIIQVYEWQK